MKSLGAYLVYLRRKMVRDKLSPNRVAAGWAIGMFVGCAIPFGFQLIVSIPLAIATRTSKIGATIGTFITNPVTIFFIYPAQTLAVHHILFGGTPDLPSEWTFRALSGLAGKTIACFFIGGIVLGLVLAPVTFFVVRRLVVVARAALARHRQARLRRTAP